MQFKRGANVFTSSDDKLGTVDRVVIDPRTKEVTHIIVRKGFLFTSDKVIPIDLVATATQNGVLLRDKPGDLEALPDFEESHQIPLIPEDFDARYSKGLAVPIYWFPPIGVASLGNRPSQLYATETQRNIPEHTIPLREGASVVSAEDEHIGNVERVFTDPADQRVTHLVIAHGLFLKERKLLPITWVDVIAEDKVRLALSSSLLDRLPLYQESTEGF